MCWTLRHARGLIWGFYRVYVYIYIYRGYRERKGLGFLCLSYIFSLSCSRIFLHFAIYTEVAGDGGSPGAAQEEDSCA